jgi:hypothetical protein
MMKALGIGCGVLVLLSALCIFAGYYLLESAFNPKLEPNVYGTGRVLDARTRQPLAGARVASRQYAEYGYQTVDDTRTDGSGAFRVGFHDSTSGGTLLVEPQGHAESSLESPTFPVDVLTDPLPDDHARVRSGCISVSEWNQAYADSFRLPPGDSHANLHVRPDSSGETPDLVLTWPVGADSSLRCDAAGAGAVRFDPAASFPRGADPFAVTCTAPSSGMGRTASVPHSASGILFLRTADGARYAKILVTRGRPDRIWYNPSGGTGLCSTKRDCDDE